MFLAAHNEVAPGRVVRRGREIAATMKRRTMLGLGAAASGGLVFGTGAFTTVTAQRSVNVSTADDGDALLALRPGDENGAYVETDGGTARIDFGEGGLGDGVGTDSRYTFDDVLSVRNQGTQPVFLFTEVTDDSLGDGRLQLFTESADTPLTAANAVELGTGEAVSVGVFLDTTGLDTGEFDVDVTIRATADRPAGGSGPTQPVTDPIQPLQLDSVSSLLASYDDSGDGATGEPLTDDSVIVATAEPTATNVDEDGDGDAVSYPEGTPIPIAALDGNVFAVTGPFVASDTRFGDFGNEELFLNAFDELLGGSGTVVHDESHGQFYSLSPNGGDDFQSFATYAENNGYSYGKEGDDLTAVLSGSDPADAVVITSPSDGFTTDELDALSEFVAAGGTVFLHDQSDFRNFDATDNLNEIAEALNVSFRFNDDQVLDDENNTGASFVPTTTAFNTDRFPRLFDDRSGLGIDIDPTQEYEVAVTEVTDGDTVNVEFQNFLNTPSDTVRIVGIDTPETGDTDERIVEYEGITPDQASDLKALAEDGGSIADQGATAYAEDDLADETVTLSFDPNEPVRGDFGRLLGFLELPNGDVYNREIVADGWARVYSSGFARHDDYWDAENQAQANGSGIWQLSDPGSVPESGDDPVSTLFFPEPVAVSGGTTAVESEAGDPLAAFDDDARVAAVGGPLIDEGFEPSETGDGEPTNDGTQVYPFVTNLLDRLADGGLTDRVVIDGGHGQFGADFGLSSEDVAYYQRYLEGQPDGADDTGSIALEGTNTLTDDAGPQLLANGDLASDALIVTTPTESFTDAERQVVADFADAGGAVLLIGSAADTEALSNFDALVSDLGADVGFTTNAVTDGTNNLGGDETLPTTTAFPGPDGLFTAFTPGPGTGVIDRLVFDSGSALLNADTGADDTDRALTDDSIVAVRSEPTARVGDSDGNGDAVDPYDDDPGTDDEIPLVAVETTGSGTVAGITAPFLQDGTDFSAVGNESFVLNLLEEYVDDGTVLWDESHGQFYTLDKFSTFEGLAEGAGYTVEATTDLTGADALVVTSPSAFTSTELSALSSFVSNGGVVVLVDQSDSNDFDQTANLNAVADSLGVGFRFDDAQVFDDQNNTGDAFTPTTTNFDTTTFPELFTAAVSIEEVDGENEYVVVRNDRTEPVALNGWTLSDETDKTFTFPSATLAAGERAVVTTNETPAGTAPSAALTLNWDRGFVWNNDGDTATIRDADGTVVDVFGY